MYNIEAEFEDSLGSITSKAKLVGAVDGDDMRLSCFAAEVYDDGVLSEHATAAKVSYSARS